MDYFNSVGVHQGFMEPFADASRLDLELLFQYHLLKQKVNSVKYSPIGKNARMTEAQNGIEIIRKSFSLQEMLLDEKKVPEKSVPGDAKFDVFLSESLFPHGKPPLLEVIFEVLEWICLGPALFTPFCQLMNYLIPEEYKQYLKDCIREEDISGNKNQKGSLKIDQGIIKSNLEIITGKDFLDTLFDRLCKEQGNTDPV